VGRAELRHGAVEEGAVHEGDQERTWLGVGVGIGVGLGVGVGVGVGVRARARARVRERTEEEEEEEEERGDQVEDEHGAQHLVRGGVG